MTDGQRQNNSGMFTSEDVCVQVIMIIAIMNIMMVMLNTVGIKI